MSLQHPKDSQNNNFMLGDIVVWGRQQRAIGTGTVVKMYKSKGWSGYREEYKIGVATQDGLVTLNKPDRALIISRSPA